MVQILMCASTNLFGTSRPPLVRPPAEYSWPFVQRRFQQLLANLQLSTDQLSDGDTKKRRVTASLNRAYWNLSNENAHSLAVGSWGKLTRVRPPRDIDLLFQLPSDVHSRFESRSGNRQSQLLQEVREVLSSTYPATQIRGDGQVVVIPFTTFTVELIPAFLLDDGSYWICDTNNGGRYKRIDPVSEISSLGTADLKFNGNVRKLVKVLKQWQRHCDVPIKSFHIEALVMETLTGVNYGGENEFWFDFLVRDVLAHMVARVNGAFHMPITCEPVLLGDAWLSKALTAHARAVNACRYEKTDDVRWADDRAAGEEWQKLFGTMIPLTVT